MRVARLLCLMVSVACLGAFAAPSGLNLMPSASIMPFGTNLVTFERPSSPKLFVPDNAAVKSTQTALFPGVMEGGIDEISGDEGHTVYNLKLLLEPDAQGAPGLAIGVQNLRHKCHPQRYLIASKSLVEDVSSETFLTVHGGWMTGESGTTTLMGVDVYASGLYFAADRARGAGIARSAMYAGISIDNYSFGVCRYGDRGEEKVNTYVLSYLSSSTE
jgi:hypothetical protein